MSGRVITIAQQKGGAGKTTLVAHLAVALRQKGKKVAVVDIDPQGSLTKWAELRDEHKAENGLTHRQISGWRTQREVEELAATHDYVLIDSAPHAEMETKTAIRAANLVLMPVQPSPMDVWATEPTIALAQSESKPVLLVLNRVMPRTRLIETLHDRIAALGAKIAQTSLGNRVGFAGAMVLGKTILETERHATGTKEIIALADEIAHIVKAA